MATASKIIFGNGLNVTDEGSGIIRVAACGGGSMWPMSYDLLPRAMVSAALDGPVGNWTVTVDSTYWTGFYWNNAGDGNQACMYARLGPKGSEWGLQVAAERNTDCGKLLFEWQVVPESATGDGYDLDGLGLIPGSTSTDFPSTFYKTTADNTIDLYGAADKNKLYAGTYSQFRIMGDDGDSITTDGTYSMADSCYHFDGGSGIWCLKMTVDGKNASSSDYNTRITFLRLTRYTAEGFPTS